MQLYNIHGKPATPEDQETGTKDYWINEILSDQKSGNTPRKELIEGWGHHIDGTDGA
jgi:hypothetical protein